jgi:hypothetical protein
MLLRLLIATALLVTTSTHAHADVMVDENAGSLSGTYTINKGVMPDKKKYKGTVQLKFAGGGENGSWETYRAVWTTGVDTTATGMGWFADYKHLILAYGTSDIAVGRLQFVDPVGGVPTIEGLFYGEGVSLMFTGTGTKKSKKGKFDGTWALSSEGTEIGTLVVKKVGKAYTLVFTGVGGSSESRGVGLLNGKVMECGIASPDGGVAVYKFKPSKKGIKLEGQWAGVAGGKLGTEVLTK